MDASFAVLAALALSPAHPYALLDHLSGLGLPVSRSALYRAVDALERDGFVAVQLETGETGHRRKRLELTGAGREQLARAALRTLRREPVDGPAFALALAAGGAIAAPGLTEVLRERMAAAARRLTALERGLRAGAAGPRAALEEREAAHLRADIAWLQGQLRRAG
ncbi:PadR family transcriptional regulator [Tepidiforma bonchosmolovskayae]|jgi:DNA-binding PadR family transcriptional regulator|uniref:PadR family transcriptional regulator n=1 Tax=Tepidiforma bonchosmolovskayae TaxID=2601677 RepID=A0ABX6C107_9CHLR|nr:PadR family transcriptional regulator [Tepidiforma bonchosmolovskayae]QFG02971.1 PadR family transcriptional regulator [Tepidiforma bonchosmolovskayae]